MLLGPRQVGKSTLVQSLQPDLAINLADQDTFFRYTADPKALRHDLEGASPRTVLIDEIQRLPGLLNTLQAIVDAGRAPRFYLTGSSARKLRQGGANLLPGRLLHYQLGPLVSAELNHQIDTSKVLRLGALPEAYLEDDEKQAAHLLSSYVASYIREEVRAEALVRNLEAFTRFTQVAFQTAGLIIDYSKLAKQARVSRHAVSRFYEIFEDTLIGQRIWPFEPLQDELELIKHPRFYVFDLGVYNAMLGNHLASADRIGILAEHLVHNQILHSAWARQRTVRLSTFRTRGGAEIDFIIELDGDVFAVEVKSNDNLNDGDVSALKGFPKAYPQVRGRFVFHLGERTTKIDDVWCRPWQAGLQALGL